MISVPEIFSKVKLKKDFKDLIYRQKISKINVSLKERGIYVELISDALIDCEELKNFKNSVIDAYLLKKFEIKIKYLESLFNDKYISDVLKRIILKTPMMKSFFSSVVLDVTGQKVTIGNISGTADFLRKYKLEDDIKNTIKNEIGILAEVLLKFKKNFIEDSVLEKLGDKQTFIQQKDKKENENNIPKNSSNDIFKGGKTTGNKKITGQTTDIISVNEENISIIIEGNIFDVNVHNIQNDTRLIVFYVSDATYSITCKLIEKIDGQQIQNIKKGKLARIKGKTGFDKFSGEICLNVKEIEFLEPPKQRIDDFEGVKRVELHAHTKMSAMDGIVDVKDLIECAKRWNHKALAITDHGSAQAFPDAAEFGKKFGIKILYGMEGYFINDDILNEETDFYSEKTYVVFDIETTGLSNKNDAVTEIGAVKIVNFKVEDVFSELVNPKRPIPQKITELTGITDAMVSDKLDILHILPKFLKFCENSVLVAHNANFDVGFIRENANKLNLDFDFKIIDTLAMSRSILNNLSKHKLDIVAKHLGICLENHHRAVDDAKCTAEIFLKLIEKKKEKSKNLDKDAYKSLIKQNSYHIIIFAKNKIGLKNLYKLISISNLEYFYRKPKIPKSVLMEHKDGLIIGSACESGELYKAIIENRAQSDIEKIASFYDFLEIQPLGNNKFLINSGLVKNEQELIDINKKIVDIGTKLGKKVVATNDLHFLNPEDEVYRRVLFGGQGYKDADDQAPLYFKTTSEMIEEFSYLGQEKAYEIVVKNTNDICDMMDEISPIPTGLYPPKIENSEEELIDLCKKKIKSIYGENLPYIVEERFNRELECILRYGFSVMYMIAEKLVKKSNCEGYLVGSRGSVGSSFVAFLSGITEINSLKPHYICENCKKSDFEIDEKYKIGIDLPDKVCGCGHKMKKDGFNIPFETFLGFKGDKVPDIDLNFSGEYQLKAHKYVETLFGEGYVFRAGTIGTIADKTAQMFARKYYEKKGEEPPCLAEMKRVSIGSVGVKRTTGQHPGGIIVCPKDMEIYDFCPVQHPADDSESEVITTHFDFHSIHDNLLKLDILGHDDPTTIKMLENLTGIDAKNIPLNDKDTIALFSSTKTLNLVDSKYTEDVGTIGVPEFGTKFVRQMLVETRPTTFSELILISGLSHGENVWAKNAQSLIKEKIAKLSEVICVRDDIMIYLIGKGLEAQDSFEITESVRKGRGLSEEQEKIMKHYNIPKWYIESCKKIKYMFPKAHAAAYVIMAFRIAYFKVKYPIEFYISYFTIRADVFDAEYMIHGEEKVKKAIKEIELKGQAASAKEKGMITILEVCLEMYARGIKFLPIDLYKSHAFNFQKINEQILPPLNSLAGLGVTAAENIMNSRKCGPFLSQEDLKQRAKLNKNVMALFEKNGCFKNLPESSQITFFE